MPFIMVGAIIVAIGVGNFALSRFIGRYSYYDIYLPPILYDAETEGFKHRFQKEYGYYSLKDRYYIFSALLGLLGGIMTFFFGLILIKYLL